LGDGVGIGLVLDGEELEEQVVAVTAGAYGGSASATPESFP